MAPKEASGIVVEVCDLLRNVTHGAVLRASIAVTGRGTMAACESSSESELALYSSSLPA